MSAVERGGEAASSKPMRIAFVSYEYAGISQGGIGTYVRNAAAMLAARGHAVEVFTSSEGGIVDGRTDSGVHLWGVDARRGNFVQAVQPVLAARHQAESFGVVEVPEIGAEGAAVMRALPGVPMVVRLHTPSFVLNEIWNSYVDRTRRLRFMAGALRRGRWPERPWDKPDTSGEGEVARAADLVVGPSQSIFDIVGTRWAIPIGMRMLVPNVFVAPARLLALDPRRSRGTVLYVGRLEVRKGVLDLADAVGSICERNPGTRFVFLGRSLPLPHRDHDTKTEMLKRIGRWGSNVEFVDGVPYEDIPQFFADADVAVFPSIWENFPNVCLEAMAAGCGVVGSSAGGMAEIIDHGRNGLLVPPRSPRAIADAVIAMLENPAQRARMGEAARAHVLAAYSEAAIGPLQEESYRRAIEQARGRASTMIRDR